MAALTSRQRLLQTIQLQQVDYLPCCFMSFTALRNRHHDNWFEVARAERSMGLDAMLFLPTAPRARRLDHPDLRGLPIHFDPRVEIREWRAGSTEGLEFLHKEYLTPAGRLTTHIRLTSDWPHGDHIPFIDDFQVPRSEKPLVCAAQDLEPLSFLLTPPSPEDVAAFRNEAETAHAFARDQDVLLAGGWGVGMDMANWLCGMQDLMLLAIDQPDFVDRLLEMIAAWNRQRMQVVLSAPVDLYIRRAWYEGCDFITPRFYRRSILPHLIAEAELAHEHGAKFGYICSSGTKPMLDLYLDAGIDVIIGVDPVQGAHTDMALMKEKLGQRVCLWGGVSGAVTVERGTEAEVRSAVHAAIQILGRQGFILSPVDNITVDQPLTWQNIAIFIDEWQKQR